MAVGMTALDDLRTTGLYLPEPFSAREVAAINAHLAAYPAFVDAHVPQTARTRGDDAQPRTSLRYRDTETYCVLNEHVVTAPHMLERALGYTDLATSYLEVDPPVMYSANSFWTRPGRDPSRPDIQEFHRDYDDVRFLAMFVYLTDVLCDDDGPHELTGPDDAVRSVFGPAGTVFLADTSREHRGRKPTTHERGLAWFRWGVSERPPANQWDKIESIALSKLNGQYPADRRLRESIRLLVA